LKNLPLPQTRIIVVDDYALVRAGVRALLEKIENVEVIAEAGGGKQALHLINQLLPDVVFLDAAVPDLNGLDVLREVTKLLKVRVIVLSVQATEERAAQALRAGAAGFLPKSAASSELELALRTVMNSERYLSPNLSPVATAGRSGLTARQLEVLQLIAMGRSTKDIADALKISVKTVETHRAQLMDRLGIYDVAGLVRYAIRVGLVTLDY
jgi:DNA-binding NarL/FixJ family response regulator